MSQSLTATADLPPLTEGDDVPFPVTIDDAAGNPITITDWTVSLTIAEIDGTPIIEKDNTTHDDPDNGKTSFTLTSSDTSGIEGTKRYDIQVTKSDGTVKTPVSGHVPFIDGVTDRSV